MIGYAYQAHIVLTQNQILDRMLETPIPPKCK